MFFMPVIENSPLPDGMFQNYFKLSRVLSENTMILSIYDYFSNRRKNMGTCENYSEQIGCFCKQFSLTSPLINVITSTGASW
jgi:hypothetical protein